MIYAVVGLSILSLVLIILSKHLYDKSAYWRDCSGDALTFMELRRCNVDRCEESFHGIHEWSESDWATAMAGEAGEACNLIKKRRRGEKIPKKEVGKELADMVIYTDLLAERLGLRLEDCIRSKFNEVLDRVKSKVKL